MSKGKYTYKNGDVYNGVLKRGKPNGKGELYLAKVKRTQIGNFKNGNLDGKNCTVKLDNGGLFKGIYKDGNRISGDYKTSTNERFKGKFKGKD